MESCSNPPILEQGGACPGQRKRLLDPWLIRKNDLIHDVRHQTAIVDPSCDCSHLAQCALNLILNVLDGCR